MESRGKIVRSLVGQGGAGRTGGSLEGLDNRLERFRNRAFNGFYLMFVDISSSILTIASHQRPLPLNESNTESCQYSLNGGKSSTFVLENSGLESGNFRPMFKNVPQSGVCPKASSLSRKARMLKEKMEEAADMEKSNGEIVADALLLLTDTSENRPANRSYFSGPISHRLSATFVLPFLHDEGGTECSQFGTVSSSVVVVRRTGACLFFERDWKSFFQDNPECSAPERFGSLAGGCPVHGGDSIFKDYDTRVEFRLDSGQ